jgi:hypothetical protein
MAGDGDRDDVGIIQEGIIGLGDAEVEDREAAGEEQSGECERGDLFGMDASHYSVSFIFWDQLWPARSSRM